VLLTINTLAARWMSAGRHSSPSLGQVAGEDIVEVIGAVGAQLTETWVSVQEGGLRRFGLSPGNSERELWPAGVSCKGS
jgi:hypothetical protein